MADETAPAEEPTAETEVPVVLEETPAPAPRKRPTKPKTAAKKPASKPARKRTTKPKEEPVPDTKPANGRRRRAKAVAAPSSDVVFELFYEDVDAGTLQPVGESSGADGAAAVSAYIMSLSPEDRETACALGTYSALNKTDATWTPVQASLTVSTTPR